MRRPGGRRCVVCDETIPKKNQYRSIFNNSSDMDDVDRGLSERLEIIFDTKLSEDKTHSSEICHLCEAKAIQIEEYFRLLLTFREMFKRTVKKYAHMQPGSQKKNSAKQKPSSAKTVKKPTKTDHSVLDKPKKDLKSKHYRKTADTKDSTNIDEENWAEERQLSNDRTCQSNDLIVDSNKDLQQDYICINDMKDEHHHLSSSQNDISLKGSKQRTASPKTEKPLAATDEIVDKTDTQQPPKLAMKRFAGKRKYKCIACSKVFANMRNLKRHQVKHSADHSAGKYDCPACDMKFTRSNALNTHIKLHEIEGVHLISCSRCSKRFMSEQDLAKHKECGCQKVKTHKCLQCELTFRCASELTNHELIHNGTKPFKCSVCGKAFSRKQILREHFRLHSGECPYKCDQCSAAFRFRSGLNFHRNKSHTGDRPHKCTLCSKTFAVLANLQSHLRLHTGEKPYLCPECGRGFAQSGTLQVHLATHCIERPYKCADCDKSFKRADILQRHTLTHTGDRPYECTQCKITYRDRRSLNKHLVGHTDARPHVCPTCGKTFRHKVNLQDHCRLHTGEKAHRCDLCGKAFALPRYLKKHLQLHAKESFRPRGESREKAASKEASSTAGKDKVSEGGDSTEVADGDVGQRGDVQSELLEYNTEKQDGISIHEGVDAGSSLLPLDLHHHQNQQQQKSLNQQQEQQQQQHQNQQQPSHHFQSDPQLDEPLLNDFQNLPTSFPSPVQTRPQCLTMSNCPTPHEFHYMSSSGSGEGAVDLGSDPRGLPYQPSPFSGQHTPLPHMSEAFNETLNLKMEKYADNVYTEMTVREGQVQDQLGSPALGIGGAGPGTFPHPGLMMPTHGAFLAQRVPFDQPLPSLYPRHHLDHGQDQEYH